MSISTCARFCSSLTGMSKNLPSSKNGSSSKLIEGAETCVKQWAALQNKKEIPTTSTSSDNTATFTFKLGRTAGGDLSSNLSVTSSESSDILESDYSEKSDEQNSQKFQNPHVGVRSPSNNNVTTTVNHSLVHKEEKDESHDAADIKCNDSEKSELDDGNDTDEDETDNKSEESSSNQTESGRKYNFDHFQIIKTV
ncbi:PREDICTED: protein kinase DC2-like, partial [Drosophila arizonae]|uniref:Protein kinase DC2-like n=1 Tax=Drosophila arizonae TaxID=7263 RepID=A0ABM1Q0F5_DROAR